MNTDPYSLACNPPLWLACRACGVALVCALLPINLATAQRFSKPLNERSTPVPAAVSFTTTELRDVTGLSLRPWFSNLGDGFPLNVEFVVSPRTGALDGSRDRTPKWPGLIVAAGKMTVPQIVTVSTEKLGAVVHDDPSGRNLVFQVDPKVANPFDLTLSAKIHGFYTFEQALLELHKASGVDLIPFSRFPISDTSRQMLLVNVPACNTLRVALNTITQVWGCHWSAAIIGDLEGSDLAKAVNPGQNALVTAQFFWPARK